MPTPDVTIHIPTPRSHPTCPPEGDALEYLEMGHEEVEQIVTSQTDLDNCRRDESPIPAKIRDHGSEDESCATEAGTSRSTTIEPEQKPDDAYKYIMPSDLGYALIPQNLDHFFDRPGLPQHSMYPSSFLRPGSKFVGTQTDKQIYSVEVQIKQVDMRQSTMCGYLKIDGLTPDFPSLITFFDGEIIGPHYSFITKHSDWGATEKYDLAHWDRFPAFRPLAKQAKNPDFHPQNISQKENIFMRWKERFLVPDHTVSKIQGASYEGFYYICFNQIKATIDGIYFHASSDRYQSLNLKHVPDHGCLASMQWA